MTPIPMSLKPLGFRRKKIWDQQWQGQSSQWLREEKDVRKSSGIQTSLNHDLEALSVQVCTDSQLFRILKWEKWHEVKLKMNYSWILTNACCNSVNIVAATILPLLLSQMKFSRNESLLQAQAEEVRFSN